MAEMPGRYSYSAHRLARHYTAQKPAKITQLNFGELGLVSTQQ